MCKMRGCMVSVVLSQPWLCFIYVRLFLSLEGGDAMCVIVKLGTEK